jgi:hypothetical protein
MKPLLPLLFSLTALYAQTGHWEGVIQLPAGEIPIQVDLDRNSAGEFRGSFSNSSEHLQGFPLADIGMKGREVYFQIKGTPGNRAFIGTLAPDSKTMTGEFKQSQFTLRFVLSRAGEAHVAPIAKLATVPKELEGIWNGSADVSGQSMQLVLNLANQTDGSASGTIHTLADDLEIPVSELKQTASDITLELKAIGGTITASLNGAQLAGTYTQGATSFPVMFRKK